MSHHPNRVASALLAGAACGFLAACGNGDPEPTSVPTGTGSHPARTDTSADCRGNCDASIPSIPESTIDGWTWGDVTTYGGVGNAEPSRGGACNYGATGIRDYAAIQVDRIPGDLTGQWDGGRICGQCFEVSARTIEGWKSTVVRIVDKCPDGFCGIDLGGAPATELMGQQPGRYSGRWRPVVCAGGEGLQDGPTSVFVKEGSNAWWSLVQIRNPPSAVEGIRIASSRDSAAWDTLTWATEAENFWKVPREALADTLAHRLEAWFREGPAFVVEIPPGGFSRPGASFAP